MHRAVTIRLPDGRSITLVDRHAVEQWNREHARRRLRDAVRDNTFVGYDLVRFADRECLVSSWDATVDEAIDALAGALARAVIVPIRIVDAVVGLRPSLGGNAPVDWDDLRPLSDLQRPEPSAVRHRPTPPAAPPAPTWVDPCDAWMSFDVVDDRGVLADGEFRCTVEGQSHEGRLERATHSFRNLSTSAFGRLQLTALFFPTSTMSIDGPVPGGTPTKPDDPHEPLTKQTRFDVVDEAGRPLVGRYVVQTSAGEITGALGGVVSVSEPGAASVRLLLEPSVDHG